MDRKTEIIPEAPELLRFSADEASLAVKALSYYATTDVQTLEANWPNEGFRAVHTTTESALERVDRISTFVNFHQNLAHKMADVVTQPDEPVELSLQEVDALGSSLFRLARSGVSHAKEAVRNRTIGVRPDNQAAVDRVNANTINDSKALFDGLGEIARSRGQGWLVWQVEAPDTV